MDYKVALDKQGRIVIPSEVRKRFGLQPGSKTNLTLTGNKLIISLEDTDVTKQVEEWHEQLLKNKAQAFSVTEDYPDSKWMSEEYGRRKAGILGRNP